MSESSAPRISGYRPNDDGQSWWCKNHRRDATYIFRSLDGRKERHCCEPELGGIMIPCECEKIESPWSNEETIVPFANAVAKQAYDKAVEVGVPQGDLDQFAAIKNILRALEGMENQIHGMLQVIEDQDKRIRALEKAGKSKIIKVVP